MEALTMNIKRKWFAEIIAGEKLIEYRKMSPFWKDRIEPLTAPFQLRLLNGMIAPVPELTVVVTQVTRDLTAQEYKLHLGEILQVLNWDPETMIKKSKAKRPPRVFNVSPALAAIVGPGSKSGEEIVRLFWAYVADHKLHDEGDDKIRVDASLRSLAGPKDFLSISEIRDCLNQHIEETSEQAGPTAAL